MFKIYTNNFSPALRIKMLKIFNRLYKDNIPMQFMYLINGSESMSLEEQVNYPNDSFICAAQWRASFLKTLSENRIKVVPSFKGNKVIFTASKLSNEG